MELQKARVIPSRVVMFDGPGSVHHVGFLHEGDVVTILEGFEYKDRTWRDKKFIKIANQNGLIGYIGASSVTPLKEKKK